MPVYNNKFKQLSIAEREEIAIAYENGASINSIARSLGRAASTIAREIKRGKHKAKYRATIAQSRRNQTKNKQNKKSKSNNYELLHQIERMLKDKWSPKIIAQKLGKIISHQTIYNIIKTIRREWKKYLVYQRKTKYHKGRSQSSGIQFRTDIAERGPIIFGDWEADTVISSCGGRSCLAVFAEKTTRIYRIVKIENKTAKSMVSATLQALHGLPVNSITYDNGTENSDHWIVNMLLNCASYFCRPYRSTDKPLVENRNKILRQFLPKGTNFDLICDDELSRIEMKINERPLECLGWRSPSEALVLQLQL